MTTTEAALALGISARRVLALIKAGALKARKPGHDWIIDAASVEAHARKPRLRGRPRKQ